MIDKYIIDSLIQLNIEQVATQLGLTVNRHKSLCPFHNDTHPSLTFNVAKNRYKCFACGASGNVIDLVMGVGNIGFVQACRWLASGTWMQSEVAAKPAAKEVKNSFDAAKYEKMLRYQFISDKARHFLFEERRLSMDVMRWARVKCWTDKRGVEWLAIPYYDEDGRLIGLQNRNLDWNNITKTGDRFMFPKGARVQMYNLNVLPLLKPNGHLWIGEGCTDCWALMSSGRYAVAVASATTCRDEDLARVVRVKERLGLTIHCVPDQDSAGENLFKQLKKSIPDILHHSLPIDYKDFSQWWASRY